MDKYIGEKGEIKKDGWNFCKGKFVVVAERDNQLKIEHESNLDSGWYDKQFVIKQLRKEEK